MKRYNPKEIEPKWQKAWADKGLYKAVDFDKRQKFVMLTEFPYPSGDGLHLGHTREYTLGDIVARHKRMLGMNVLYPMGYDAFGLPTENYAIKNKIAPQVATDQNIANFQKQFESLGFGIDWSRSFRTTDPAYYKWTQWLFLQFFKAGLAYQEEIAINWCPHCKTGLSNEEVVNGRHERCDTLVEKKLLEQWLLRITNYADRLIDGLNDVDYPSRIADQQINWIGCSKGAEVDFKVDDSNETIRVFTTRPDTLFGATFMVLAPEHPLVEQITTAEQRPHVNSYVRAAQAKTDVERQETSAQKTGVATGAYAINPVNDEKIPIWIADYVLLGYGTGAIMAVPAHDERDHEFAKKFDLPMKPVITPTVYWGGTTEKSSRQNIVRPTVIAVAYDAKTDKYCMLNWHLSPRTRREWPRGGLNEGESVKQAALREFSEETGYSDVELEAVVPAAAVSFYWIRGTETMRSVCSIVKLRVNSLKIDETIEKDEYEKDAYEVEWLSRDEILGSAVEAMDEVTQLAAEFVFGETVHVGEGAMINSGKYDNLSSDEAREKIVADLEKKGLAKEKINYRLRDWIFSRQHYWGEPIPIIHCPDHGAVAVPDDQLPVELPKVEHYEPTDSGKSPLAEISEWVNTTCPTCGKPAKRETDTMPNWAGSSWYYLRYYDAHNDEAFADQKKLEYWGMVDMYLGGMEHTTLHLLYSRFWHQFFYDQRLVPTPEPYKARRGQGIILAADGSKMSKSKGNVVNPTDIIENGYGADALRLAIAFLAPYDQTTPWSPEGVAGTYRFLDRVWRLVQEFTEAENTGEQQPFEKEILRTAHQTIKKVTTDLEQLNFNTAISAQMEMVNVLYKLKEQDHFANREAWQFATRSLLKILAPFAPHIAEELWHELGHDDSIHLSDWPSYDEKYFVSDVVKIVVQVNGKLRAELELPADVSEADAVEAAKNDAKVKSYLEGKEVKKTIYVPRRLINLVIG